MTNSPAFLIGYIVLIFAFMYFIAIRAEALNALLR